MSLYEQALEKSWRIGGNLRRIREERKMTQLQLADLAEMRSINISRVERGENIPSVFTLIMLTNALGVTFEDLTR